MTVTSAKPDGGGEGDPPESVRSVLRRKTAHLHTDVDAAFARFNLETLTGYGAFLMAHARATPRLETALIKARSPWPFRPRTPALQSDLKNLGLPAPDPWSEGEDDVPVAALWGRLYVLEGSRLGGGVIASGIDGGLPRLYLESRHLKGEWVSFQTALERAAEDADSAFIADAVKGAEDAFALYAEAARTPLSAVFLQN